MPAGKDTGRERMQVLPAPEMEAEVGRVERQRWWQG